MKKTEYQLKQRGDDEVLGTYGTPQKAAEAMAEIIEDNNDDLDEDEEGWVTPFDFHLEEVEVEQEINELVDSYEAASRYLNLTANGSVKLSHVNPRHLQALISLNALFTIADAWNKADNFVPDFDNTGQRKWWPWFRKTPAGFVCATTNYTASTTSAILGSRLCFKSSERARQFGEQFIDLWNDFLLF